MLVCKAGQKATIESIQEVLFPTEYEPSDMPSNTPNVAVPTCLVDRKAAAFEPRNVGVTFEIESTLAINGMIDLRLSPEIVKQLRLETWMKHIDQWGDATYRLPVFESFRIQSKITVAPGKFEFVSALTPNMNTQGPVVTRKILVFVRADLLPASLFYLSTPLLSTQQARLLRLEHQKPYPQFVILASYVDFSLERV